jgi:hypothetical protein
VGFNRSIYFMLAMVALVTGGFTFLIWNSYRTARARSARGPEEQPREHE